MSNAKWRPSTSAANVPHTEPETSSAAQLQSLLDRLKQRPSLLATQTALTPGSSSGQHDARESHSQSPRRDTVSQQRGSARCRSSTGVARWESGGPGRRGSATPRSAERRRSRYSDVNEPTERLPLTDRSDTRRNQRAAPRKDDVTHGADDRERRTDDTVQKTTIKEDYANNRKRKNDTTDRSADIVDRRGDTTDRKGDATDRRADTTPRRGEVGGGRAAASRRTRHLTPADTSQSALSSADSSAATSTSAALTPDTGTQSSLTGSSPRPPAGSPARQFQVRPRREPPPDTTKQPPAQEKAVEGGGKKLASGIPPIVRKTLMDFDRIQKLKYAAETAIREKKVFMIHGGYPSIRLALKRRGWVEKKYLINRSESEDDIDVSRWPMDADNPAAGIGLADVLGLKGSKNSMILTRLLKDHQPNLIWSAKREVIDYVNLERDQLVNHFPRAPFNTKVGLCSLSQSLHWYSESQSADTFIPRAFRIGLAEEKQAFVEDFRLTACAGLLVWFKERYELHGAAGVEDAEGEVPYSVIPTALQQCQSYIATRQHEDIEPTAFNRALWPHQWDNFLTNVYKLVHKSKKLEKHRDESSTIVKVFYNRISQLLSDLVQYRPQTLLDGWLNIWIVKPGSSSRGRGIILLRQLEDVLALVDSVTQREGKYVVQKYIERPMLIYNTKFDIRQWFLVTDWNPLTVWMYKQSYLRFCSQQFTLGDLKEAVHLCNNAVQARYRNGERHAALPTENMWDSSTFQQFLKSREAGHAWEQIIYPAMKSAIISLCLASQTEVEPRRGCFELFGADFLLTEDFHPWLIEVNSSPAMGASTSVTAWLCAMCLEDVIRVIVDRRRDSHADVGEFECILQQPAVSSPRYLGIDLSVHGHRLKPPPSSGPPAPPPPPESPAAPPRPAAASSVTSRASEVLSRLTSLPSAAAASAAAQVRRRSRSQAAPAPAASSTSGPAAPTGAATPPRRNRSVSQTPPTGRRAAPAPAQPPPASQKPRQRAAAKKAAARRRSRTQIIQNSVRRLSDPRRPRSGQQRRPGTVTPAVAPPQPPPLPPPPASCPVPRPSLELTALRREPASPRAQQLVTCDRLQERPESAARRRRQPASATCLPAAGGPGKAAHSTLSLQTGRETGRETEKAAAGQTDPVRPSPPQRQPPAETEPPATARRFISSSMDKLDRLRRSSEAALRRINSLSLAPAGAAGAGAEAGVSTVEEVEVKQTGKVQWVAMPAPHPPPRFSATSAAGGSSPDMKTAASTPRTGSSNTRTVTPAPRTVSSGATQPAVTAAPRTVSPVPRTLSPVPRVATPVCRSMTPQPRSVAPAPRANACPRTGCPAVSPRSAARSSPPPARPVPDSAPGSTPGDPPQPPGGSGLLPALDAPPAAQPPAAFNARITELKTLIDRAIEETREFLGRSRETARTAPSVSSEPVVTPRACLSPTIVDIAVRRPGGSAAGWELAAAEGAESPRAGSARPSPRRGVRPPAGRPETPRLTELVGLQGRRFLPPLSAPEPAPRRSR